MSRWFNLNHADGEGVSLRYAESSKAWLLYRASEEPQLQGLQEAKLGHAAQLLCASQVLVVALVCGNTEYTGTSHSLPTGQDWHLGILAAEEPVSGYPNVRRKGEERKVKTRVIETWSWFPVEHSPYHLSSKSDQSEFFLKIVQICVFMGHVKSWSRKEKCAENERVSPQVTLPLKWV